MTVRRNIPTGKFRVICVDLFSREYVVIKDCDTKEEAFKIADEHNSRRSGPMSDVFYVYNDQGYYIRGNEDVNGPGVSP